MMGADLGTPVALEGWLDGIVASTDGSGIAWLDEERSRARERARRLGIPRSKHEDWRYTSTKAIFSQGFTRHPEAPASIDRSGLDALLVPGLDAHRAVLVNGRFSAALSNLGSAAQGVRVASLREMLAQTPELVMRHLNKIAGGGKHLFAALNTADMEDALVLSVDREIGIDRPLEILHITTGAEKPRVAQPRYLVVIKDGARALLLERYVSLGALEYCTNALLEIRLEHGAQLEHYRIQTEGENAYHLSGLYLSQAEDSRYSGFNLGLGGVWSRTDLMVRLVGRGANCALNGLYLAGDRQLMDYHVDVDHATAHCTSRESFKGILNGKGRAVFDGRIHVAKNAQKTDAHLANKNLLLSRSAEVDTKPQLEIFADDVKCSHGTTVGQLEPEALFYLRSRGISETAARRMLCLGFAEEILDVVTLEPLRLYVAEQVGARLDEVALP